jgi:MOSC domain-containing protein YiiM
MNALLDHASDGSLIRKGGIMGIVLVGGRIQAGDAIAVVAPAGAPHPLGPV